MKTVVRFITMAGVLLTCMFLLSASTWEGTAILGSYGDFPANGYYAACNSFSRNTVVEVTNVDNGLKVSVIITRGLDNAGVFMLLSAEAAQALGVMQGVVARVSATEPKSATSLNPSKKTGTASFDPDFDPKRMAESELKKLGYVVEAPPVAAPVAVAPVAAPPITAPVALAPAVTAPAIAPTVSVAPAIAAPIQAPLSSAAAPDAIATRILPPASSQTQLPAPVAQNFKPVERPNTVAAAVPGITEAPMVINGKPKPVRTIILAALPEPQAAPPAPVVSTAKIPESPPVIAPIAPATVPAVGPDISTAVQKPPVNATVMVAPVAPVVAREKPEVIGKPMPTPDETPVIVQQTPAPKRLEPASVYPDTYVRSPSIPMVPDTVISAKVSEPAIVRAQTLDRSKAANVPTSPYIVLAEPTAPRVETALVLDKNGKPLPPRTASGTLQEPAAPRTETASVLERNNLARVTGTVSGELIDPSIPLIETASVIDWYNLAREYASLTDELRDPSLPLIETASVIDWYNLAREYAALTDELRDPAVPLAETAYVLERNDLVRVSQMVSGDLLDPSMPLVEAAYVLERNDLVRVSQMVSGDLIDPSAPQVETANVLDRSSPGYYANGLAVELAMPELSPDQLPEIVLRSLAEPRQTIPETNLAEGEVQFAEEEKVLAMTLDTPYYDAAETVVELAEANEKETEKPVASIQGPLLSGTPLSLSLVDAAEQKAEATSSRPAPLVASKTGLPQVALADATVGSPSSAAVAPVSVQPVVVAPAKGDTIVTLTPTGPKAPGTTEPVKPAVAAVVSPPASQTVVTSTPLKKDFFYIQLAAYTSEQAVRDAAGKLGKKYITLVESITVKGKPMYRLYVGPLSRDESGVALVQVRALGFKDAFIKQGS